MNSVTRNIKDDYNSISAFKEYVDKYSTKHQISVDEALKHELIKTVWPTYLEDGSVKPKTLPPTHGGCGC